MSWRAVSTDELRWGRRDEMTWGHAELLWLEDGHRTALSTASRTEQNVYLGRALNELSDIFCGD